VDPAVDRDDVVLVTETRGVGGRDHLLAARAVIGSDEPAGADRSAQLLVVAHDQNRALPDVD
jgi:hypothetical protein